jgi:cell division protein ZapB
MPSSRPDKTGSKKGRTGREPHEINQLGLDFAPSPAYSSAPRKEMETMNQELIEVLEKKIGEIVEKYTALKEENALLHEELERLSSDREGIKSRVDALLGKLDGI